MVFALLDRNEFTYPLNVTIDSDYYYRIKVKTHVRRIISKDDGSGHKDRPTMMSASIETLESIPKKPPLPSSKLGNNNQLILLKLFYKLY